MRKWVLAALTIGTLVALAGPSSSAGGQPVLCENTYGGDLIYARNMGCSKARDVVRTWAVRMVRDGRVNRGNVLGFRCRGRNDAVEGLVMRCAKGRKSVTFFANAPR